MIKAKDLKPGDEVVNVNGHYSPDYDGRNAYYKVIAVETYDDTFGGYRSPMVKVTVWDYLTTRTLECGDLYEFATIDEYEEA